MENSIENSDKKRKFSNNNASSMKDFQVIKKLGDGSFS